VKDALEKKIIAYLQSHSVCTVATADEGRPLASTVEYVNSDLTIYFVSIAGTQKVRNLRRNPAVAITVNDAHLDLRGVKGVQMFGRASCIDEPHRQEEIRTLFFDKFAFTRLVHWQKTKSVFFEVTPERVDFIDYTVEFGHKDVWTR
jgi:nitroimidazol reductase NimA-like FMN-containing flavoprotein (pyridoxamine 5'-phosphate oxidase superfamily)